MRHCFCLEYRTVVSRRHACSTLRPMPNRCDFSSRTWTVDANDTVDAAARRVVVVRHCRKALATRALAMNRRQRCSRAMRT